MNFFRKKVVSDTGDDDGHYGRSGTMRQMTAVSSQFAKLQELCPLLGQPKKAGRYSPAVATLDRDEVQVCSTSKGIAVGQFYHAYFIKRISLRDRNEEEEDDGSYEGDKNAKARENIAVSTMEHDPGFYNIKFISKKTYKKLQSLNSSTKGETSLFARAIINLFAEATYLSKFQHPNILQLKGNGRMQAMLEKDKHDAFFLVTERIQETLADRLEGWRKDCSKDNSLHPIGPSCPRFGHKLQFCQQIASALEYLHARNIMVLGLNPSSIGFLANSGRLQLCDLGMCRESRFSERLADQLHPQEIDPYESIRFDDDEVGEDGEMFSKFVSKEAQSLLAPSVINGTIPRYIAPEVITSGELTIHADVYSWAMITLEILTLDVPHGQYKSGQYYVKVCLEGKRPNLAVYTGIPANLAAVLKRSWRETVEKRIPSSKIASFLEEMLAEMEELTEKRSRDSDGNEEIDMSGTKGGSKGRLRDSTSNKTSRGSKRGRGPPPNDTDESLYNNNNVNDSQSEEGSFRSRDSGRMLPTKDDSRAIKQERRNHLKPEFNERGSSTRDDSNVSGKSNRRRSSEEVDSEQPPFIKDGSNIRSKTGRTRHAKMKGSEQTLSMADTSIITKRPDKKQSLKARDTSRAMSDESALGDKRKTRSKFKEGAIQINDSSTRKSNERRSSNQTMQTDENTNTKAKANANNSDRRQPLHWAKRTSNIKEKSSTENDHKELLATEVSKTRKSSRPEEDYRYKSSKKHGSRKIIKDNRGLGHDSMPDLAFSGDDVDSRPSLRRIKSVGNVAETANLAPVEETLKYRSLSSHTSERSGKSDIAADPAEIHGHAPFALSDDGIKSRSVQARHIRDITSFDDKNSIDDITADPKETRGIAFTSIKNDMDTKSTQARHIRDRASLVEETSKDLPAKEVAENTVSLNDETRPIRLKSSTQRGNETKPTKKTASGKGPTSNTKSRTNQGKEVEPAEPRSSSKVNIDQSQVDKKLPSADMFRSDYNKEMRRKSYSVDDEGKKTWPRRSAFHRGGMERAKSVMGLAEGLGHGGPNEKTQNGFVNDKETSGLRQRGSHPHGMKKSKSFLGLGVSGRGIGTSRNTRTKDAAPMMDGSSKRQQENTSNKHHGILYTARHVSNQTIFSLMSPVARKQKVKAMARKIQL